MKLAVKKSFRCRSQEYWLVGTEAYETPDGRMGKLQCLFTHCPSCGEGFVLRATATAVKNRHNLRRRCDKCKRPGVPVEYRRKALGSGAPREATQQRPAAPITAAAGFGRCATPEIKKTATRCALLDLVAKGVRAREVHRLALGMLEP